MAVTTVLAGGIEEVARHHMADLGITVVVGQAGSEPGEVVVRYLASPAEPRRNPCANMEHRHHHCRQRGK